LHHPEQRKGVLCSGEHVLAVGTEVNRMDNRIAVNPAVAHGQACVAGTRILVHQIIRMLANGDTIEDLLEAYPSLTRKDITACLEPGASGPFSDSDSDSDSLLAFAVLRL
jgi:uncharacterized protein (DUF433 family)